MTRRPLFAVVLLAGLFPAAGAQDDVGGSSGQAELGLGCFSDKEPRTLPARIMGDYSVASCVEAAAELGYRYAGLQGGHECWAGNALDAEKVEPEQCSAPCREEGQGRCGGAWKNSVYETHAAAATQPGIILIEGFGKDARGGWQDEAETYWVTSLADSGTGSLREAVESGGRPRVVRFQRSGDIRLSQRLVLPSNLTIDGRGRNVRLFGKGLAIWDAHDVIVTHLAIANVYPDSEDGIQIGKSRDVALDHLWLYMDTTGQGTSKKVDEAISVVEGSKNLTIAWCKFEQWEKAILLGNGQPEWAEADKAMRVTAHHNLFRATGRRHPEARWGIFDFYNNYLYDWQMLDSKGLAGNPKGDSFGAKCREGCRLLMENNVFARKEHTRNLKTNVDKATWCADGGVIESKGSFVLPWNEASAHMGVWCPKDAVIFPNGRPYEASVDAGDAVLARRLETETGSRPQARSSAPERPEDGPERGRQPDLR